MIRFCVGRILVYAARLLRAEFRETEIEDLHPPVVRDEKILRFEIAMDDAFGVRGGRVLLAICRA